MTIIHRPSHVGLCVADLDRSVRFWCDGLGFEQAERYDLTDALAPGIAEALEVPSPVDLTSQMIVHGELKIELLHYRSPSVEGTPSTSRRQRGLTHVSFWVDDVDAAAARLVEFGGTILPTTRTNPGIAIQFLEDPDGTRVELMGGA
jgi:catechol 2,3-dioxygenase-like lactoylglutathione lyase family enzyme